jgi:hypothetical protein
MRRRVWNIVAVASLLVSMAAAGLWVHSQFGAIQNLLVGRKRLSFAHVG